MGVPALFRWLSQKYPRITSPVVEEKELVVNGHVIPVDFSKPNPNGVEFDNLYLDMNGIIHPCCHPDDKAAPATEDDMMIAIFEYIDRIMAMIRPRKVLYMAVDGVAPRAKMNQQRSRRFRAAQEAQEAAAKEQELRADLAASNHPFGQPDSETPSDKFDSNCITPGTPFMANLVVALRYYVAHRLNTNPGWRDLKVLLSDASVPGEGEHKVMDFVRRQRCEPGYDANTRHVLYGLDADLIMLGLATHEPHFTILREDVFANEKNRKGNRNCHNCGQPGHRQDECPNPKVTINHNKGGTGTDFEKKPYLFLHVPILREYLEAELYFKEQETGFRFDLERAIDDWVFLCFFVGNDFLPHLPCLEIREGAIDLLIDVYKNNLRKMGGYLTSGGHAHLDRVQHIFHELGVAENNIFKLRKEHEDDRAAQSRRRAQQAKLQKAGFTAVQIQEMMAEFDMEERESVMSKAQQEMDAEARAAERANKAAIKERNTKAIQEMAIAVPRREVKSITNAAVAERLRQKLAAAPLAPSPDTRAVPSASTTDPAAAVTAPLATTVATTDEPMAVDSAEPAATATESESIPTISSKRSLKDAGLEGDAAESEPAAKKQEVADDEEEEEDEEAEQDDEAEDSSVDDLGKASPVPAKVLPAAVKTTGAEDTVELHKDGWRERYYDQKFHESSAEFRTKVAHAYMEGLCWVLHYYYVGCPSWKWFYPYHYAPFASDFVEIAQLKIEFELGEPFKPVEQLMGVFPAASRKHIPSVFHDLMTSDKSEIIDFYPVDFEVDLNGKKHAWQGVALLPFIDEQRLLKAINERYPHMSEADHRLNSRGTEVMMVSSSHPLFPTFCSVYQPPARADNGEPDPIVVRLDMILGNLGGTIRADVRACLPGGTLVSPFPDHPSQRSIKNNKSLSVVYAHPAYDMKDFKPYLLPGTQLPGRVLTWGDITFAFNKHRRRSPHILVKDYGTQATLTRPPGAMGGGSARPSGGSTGSGGYDSRGGSARSSQQSQYQHQYHQSREYNPRSRGSGDAGTTDHYRSQSSYQNGGRHYESSRSSTHTRDDGHARYSESSSSRSYSTGGRGSASGYQHQQGQQQAWQYTQPQAYAAGGVPPVVAHHQQYPGIPPAMAHQQFVPPVGAQSAAQQAQMMQLQMQLQMQMQMQMQQMQMQQQFQQQQHAQHAHQHGQQQQQQQQQPPHHGAHGLPQRPPQPNLAWSRNLRRGGASGGGASGSGAPGRR
ncbi:5'-3' exoribonuclease 2 [Allomyces javanicus]|nr:5'-3' exoribonuclease 2 [Allomyces javanicus]